MSNINPWLQFSGPEAQWTDGYRAAGVDPWKLKRNDGYELFSPWLEMQEIPLAEKYEYIKNYTGPDNPQIDYWRDNLRAINTVFARSTAGGVMSPTEEDKIFNRGKQRSAMEDQYPDAAARKFHAYKEYRLRKHKEGQQPVGYDEFWNAKDNEK